MNTITVITPIHAPAARHLPEAADSLHAQVLPDGWELEWVIVEDGSTRKVATAAAKAGPTGFLQNRRGGGPGVARNLAVGFSKGDIIKNLDADDILTPGALARDIEALDQLDVRWAASEVLDLLPDGTTEQWVNPNPTHGRITRGSSVPPWLNDRYLSVHPTTIAIERELLVYLGGWMALPVSEDTGMLLAASEISDGWFTAEPGLLYRKWPGQMTAADNDETKPARDQLIIERLRAMESVAV